MSVYLFIMVYEKIKDLSDTTGKLEYKVSLFYQILNLDKSIMR
jgi:hypothetical protein